jgi:hypothetical protein
MGEEEGCGNRKSDVASLGRKLKLHLLVYNGKNKHFNIVFSSNFQHHELYF